MSRPTPTERANAFPIPLTGTGRIVDRVFRDRLAAQFAAAEADARREAIRECIQVVLNERLDDVPDNAGDHGYMSAINDCVGAIEALLAEPGEGK